MGVIYTIGHGNKSFEEFLLELNSLGIKYLIDIRSKPYSKWSTHFNQEPLKALLQRKSLGILTFLKFQQVIYLELV